MVQAWSKTRAILARAPTQTPLLLAQTIPAPPPPPLKSLTSTLILHPSPKFPHISCPAPKDVISIPDELDESTCRSSRTCANLGFFQACIHICRAPELAWLSSPAHPVPGLLHHFHIHGSPITSDAAMDPESFHDALWCDYHSFAMRKATVILTDLAKQTAMGNIVVLRYLDVRRFPGLWISPLGIIPR